MVTDFNKIIDSIYIKLQQKLPGNVAQERMAPTIRNFNNFKQDNLPKQSAVMLLLYPKNNELHIAYFKRPEYDGPHSGQIAFPGGKAEKQDQSLQETALRETMEEFGINRQIIRVLGTLTKLFIPISNMEVTPYIGFIESNPIFSPQKEEVLYIIETPIKNIIDTTLKTIKTRHRHNVEIDTPMYIFENEEIWGATAMITSEFEDILGEIL